MMEQINSDKGTNTTVHGGTGWSDYKYTASPPRDGAWHVYAAKISTGRVDFYLDGVVIQTVLASQHPGQWPFDTVRQFLRLNVAMGGDWPGSPNGSAVLPAAMTVDYVRVWQ